jgi:hypothetical protein
VDRVNAVTDSINGFPVESGGIINAVALGVLEVRVTIGGNEVTSSDNLIVVGDPGGPGVDVTNFDGAAALNGGKHASNIIDLLGKSASSGVSSVQVLGTDVDSNEPVDTVLLDSAEKSGLLGLVVGSVLGPDGSEDLSTSSQSSWNGVDQSVTVGGSVDTGGCKVTWEGLHGGEVVGPVGLSLTGAIGLGGYEVESLPVCVGGGEGGSEGQSVGSGLHCGNVMIKKVANVVVYELKRKEMAQ